MNPTIAGFITFIAQVMAISTTYLPANSPYIQLAYDTATAIVNPQLRIVRSPVTSPTIYAQAVYNLAGDILVNIAQDQPDQTFFSGLRADLDINGFVGGVIQSASDEATSEAMVVPEQVKTFTLANLQNLKTPWGRYYLGLAQSVGTMWGIS